MFNGQFLYTCEIIRIISLWVFANLTVCGNLPSVDQKRIVIIAGGIILFVLVVILGTIFYLKSNTNNRQSLNETPAPQPSEQSQFTPLDNKVYKDLGFDLYYPASWGLLTCNDSKNIEFNPENRTDQIGVSCNYAVKPITVLVGEGFPCQGEMAKLGSLDVVRLKKAQDGYISYEWCVKSKPELNITHRVSETEAPASSKNDFSAQIEQIISGIRTP